MNKQNNYLILIIIYQAFWIAFFLGTNSPGQLLKDNEEKIIIPYCNENYKKNELDRNVPVCIIEYD